MTASESPSTGALDHPLAGGPIATTASPAERPRVPVAWLLVPLGACVLIALATVLGGGGLGKVAHPADMLVLRYEGTGTQKIPTKAVVQPGWELRWDSESKLHQIRWTDEQGHSKTLTSLPARPIRGHTGLNIADGGTFEIDVTADGPWTIEVYQLLQPE